MGRIWKIVLAAVSVLAVIAHTVLTLGVTGALTHRYGAWAFLINFILMSLSTVAVFGFSALLMRSPWIAKRLAVDLSRFETPFWKWVRTRGIFPMTVIVTWLLSPVVAAGLLQRLAIPERQAWFSALASNAIVSSIAVALYLGVFGIIRSKLQLHGSI